METTADLELQKVAQTAVIDGVHTADNRVGWRGVEETLEAGAIEARLAEQETALTKEEGDSILFVAAGGTRPSSSKQPTSMPSWGSARTER